MSTAGKQNRRVGIARYIDALSPTEIETTKRMIAEGVEWFWSNKGRIRPRGPSYHDLDFRRPLRKPISGTTPETRRPVREAGGGKHFSENAH